MNKKIITLLAAAIISAGYSLASLMDYDQAVADERNYCEMVSGGNWPDYQGNFDRICHGYSKPANSYQGGPGRE